MYTQERHFGCEDISPALHGVECVRGYPRETPSGGGGEAGYWKKKFHLVGGAVVPTERGLLLCTEHLDPGRRVGTRKNKSRVEIQKPSPEQCTLVQMTGCTGDRVHQGGTPQPSFRGQHLCTLHQIDTNTPSKKRWRMKNPEPLCHNRYRYWHCAAWLCTEGLFREDKDVSPLAAWVLFLFAASAVLLLGNLRACCHP